MRNRQPHDIRASREFPWGHAPMADRDADRILGGWPNTQDVNTILRNPMVHPEERVVPEAVLPPIDPFWQRRGEIRMPAPRPGPYLEERVAPDVMLPLLTALSPPAGIALGTALGAHQIGHGLGDIYGGHPWSGAANVALGAAGVGIKLPRALYGPSERGGGHGAGRSKREAEGPAGAGANEGGLPGRGELPGGNGGLPAPGGSGNPYTPIPGMRATVRLPGIGEIEPRPIPQLVEAARDYHKREGTPYLTPAEMPPFDPALAKRIAEAYERMPHAPQDMTVRQAYDRMLNETARQYEALRSKGVEFRFNEPGKDPYAASPALGYLDMRDRGRLSIFPTIEGHGSPETKGLISAADIRNNPMLADSGWSFGGKPATLNDLFRAVHDAFGHFTHGNPFFRARGENDAWNFHVPMYSATAVPAMTGELRGQNAWTNFGPYAAHNKGASGADTIFAPQKIGLPEPFTYLQGRAQLKRGD